MRTLRGLSEGRSGGRIDADRWLLRCYLLLPVALLVLFFAVPMLTVAWRSLVDDATGTVGLANYVAVLRAARIWQAVWNSLVLGAATTGLALPLGFLLAYGVERTAMPGKRIVLASMGLPVLAPSLVLGLGLIFLLGRNGVLGHLTSTRPDIYGLPGLVLADVLYVLPEAVLILRAALRRGDDRQHEAAQMLGAGPWRRFLDITLPGMRDGIGRAAFVVFTVTITDFGNAVVIGGNFPVLATELYNQVSGQMRLGMGAVVGMLLMLPAALSVWADRRLARAPAPAEADTGRRTYAFAAARDLPFSAACMTVAAGVALVFATVVLASLVQLWPYRFGWTLRHYGAVLSGGLDSLLFSMRVSAQAALIGTVTIFMMAVAMRRRADAVALLASLLAAAPVTVPGLVLGLAYLLAFNDALPPLNALYGSASLIVLCNTVHYYTQGHAMVSTGLRAVPAALEDAVAMLGGGNLAIVRDVYLPALAATLSGLAAFLFMRSMVTLSAVIFLVTPDLPLAAVAVMRLDEAGFTAQAAAFSTCIMATVALSMLAFRLCGRWASRALPPR